MRTAAAKGVLGYGAIVAIAFACGSPDRQFDSPEAEAGAAGNPTGGSGEWGGSASGSSGADGGGNVNGGEPAGGSGAVSMAGQPVGGEPPVGVDPCEADPCINGGVCSARDDRAVCECPDGYEGDRCEQDVDDCAGNPCKNGGTCADGPNEYTCSCTNRYTGEDCEYLEVKLVPSTFLNGAYWTTAAALSNDGKVLLMNLSDSSGSRGIARLVDFDAANTLSLSSPYTDGIGRGIDNDGSTLTGQATTDESDVAVKVVGTVTSALSLDLDNWQNDYSYGLDVSADGTTVVGRVGSFSGGATAFYCKAGKACREVPMDANGITKDASSVNGDGTVVVGFTYPSDPSGIGTAWRWLTSAAKATVLTLGAGTWSLPSANGVSRDGKVVVGEAQINGVPHAVRWSGSSFAPADLGTGRARATNADGSVTVGVDNSNVPVVWLGTTRHTLASLLGNNPDLTGATLTDLVGVSDDGKVVGGTAKISGNDRAFMARLP
jgi:probable HAF family extracellular repeat protein